VAYALAHPLVRSNCSSSHDNSISSVQPKPLDLSWQPVDERDEVELISDPDTEDTDLEVKDSPEEHKEERTSAIVIAEEGRGSGCASLRSANNGDISLSPGDGVGVPRGGRAAQYLPRAWQS
jgi:hypothetical protein